MEQVRLKPFPSSCVALVTKGSGSKRGPCPPQKSPSKGVIAKRQMAKGNRQKNMTRVKCYGNEKKGHYSQDYPEPSNVYLSPRTFKMRVCFHVFVANSLPQWIVDT